MLDLDIPVSRIPSSD